MSRLVVLMAALALAASVFAAERPNIVLLGAVEGLVTADSSAAAAFEAGMREAFESDFYLTEDTTVGARRVSMALANTFRRVHGKPFGDEWRVRLTVSTDSIPRLLVRVAILSPKAVASGAGPDFVTEEFSFEVPLEPRAAWFSHAGRAAGLLAVEALHRRSGDLAPDTRVRIDRTVRKPMKSKPAAPNR